MFINTIQYILYNIQIQIIPSIMSQQQTKQNKESIKEEIKAEKKPVVQYRIEPLRVIQILNQHSDKKKRAKVLATLRSSLFGKKRYQNIYVNCSLNNLFNALRITHFLNNKVPNLAMIIRFSPFKIIEMHSNNQASVIQRKKIEIKLTYLPSTQDKNEPGYNPGKPVQQIIDPITDMPQYRNRQKKYTQKPRRQQRNQQNNEGFKYRQAKHERLEEQEQNPREQKRYQNYQHKNRQNKQSHQVRQSKHQRLQDQQADRSYQRTEVRKTRGGHKQNNERHNEPKQLKDHTYRSEHLNKQ